MSDITPAVEGDLTLFAAQMSPHDQQALLDLVRSFSDATPYIDIVLKRVRVTGFDMSVLRGDAAELTILASEVEITRSTT